MKRKLTLFLLSCCCFAFSWAQNRQVSGRVVSDSSGRVLSGVNVSLKGTSTGTATNNEGYFSLTSPDRSNPVLVFSSIGYAAQEVNVGYKNHHKRYPC